VTLHPMLLEILVCPDCKGPLTVDSANDALVCDDCGLVYPVRDGIPIMLVSEARRPDAKAAGADAAASTDASADDGDASDAEPTDD
jgi:uncharacterized protein